jgi:hypothetical protein
MLEITANCTPTMPMSRPLWAPHPSSTVQCVGDKTRSLVVTASAGAVNVTGMFVLATTKRTVFVASAMVVAGAPVSAPPVVGGVAVSRAAVLGDAEPGDAVVVALSEDESSPPHAASNSALASAAARTPARVDRVPICFLLHHVAVTTLVASAKLPV